jgi:hypothetical protein
MKNQADLFAKRVRAKMGRKRMGGSVYSKCPITTIEDQGRFGTSR